MLQHASLAVIGLAAPALPPHARTAARVFRTLCAPPLVASAKPLFRRHALLPHKNKNKLMLIEKHFDVATLLCANENFESLLRSLGELEKEILNVTAVNRTGSIHSFL